MFGFGWVRTHLGDVFLESIRVFILIFGWISGKMDEISKSGVPTLRRMDPTQQHRSTPRRGMSTP